MQRKKTAGLSIVAYDSCDPAVSGRKKNEAVIYY
jgi:hypothetical protein